MKKRIVAMFLCLCLLCSLAATASAQTDPMNITIFGLPTTIPENDPILPVIEEKLGINIETIATNNDESLLVSRIAGGDIPDVFRVTNINNLKSYYENEVLLDLTPYLEKMPNLTALYEESDWARVSFKDGIWGIPRRAEENYNCWYIRYDWLEELGVADPTNFDELLELCKKINEADLDGNGKQDTYALSGTYNTTYGRDAFAGFYTAYNCAAPDTILIKDNKAVLSCTLDEFKMALNEIRRFVDAGVVDPEILSNSNTTVLEKMATGKTGVAYGAWCNYNKPDQVDTWKAVEPDAQWGRLRKEIASDIGMSGAYQSACGYDAVYAINADLAEDEEKLDAVLKLFDYIATDEGDALLSFGIKDVHYTVDENGTIVKLPEMDNLKHAYAIQFLGRKDMEYCMTKFALCAEAIEYCANEIGMVYHYGEFVEQPDGMSLADIKAYINEQIAAFIYGSRSMDEYDDFVKTLYDLYGLQIWLDDANVQLAELGFIK